MKIALILIVSICFSGCISVCDLKPTRDISDQAQERTFLQGMVYEKRNDGPFELIDLNASLKQKLADKQNQLNALYQKYISDAHNSHGGAEFAKAQDLWTQLREQDSLLAARGDHGYTLARCLYLKEKLNLTDARIEYLRKCFGN